MNLMLFFNAFQYSLDIVQLMMSLNFSIGSMNTLVFIFLFYFTYFTKIFT